MPDPIAAPSAAPPPLPPAAAAPSAPSGRLDVSQIKSMLNLPETATDIELVTALVELVGNLQQKYDALLSDAVTLEDKVANRDLEDFADIIGPETADFWRGQLLANRDDAIGVLRGIREGVAAKSAAAESAGHACHGEAQRSRVPLHNRLADQPRSIAELAGGPAPADTQRAVAIRNRAHALRRTEQLPWGEAFARAEKEYIK